MKTQTAKVKAVAKELDRSVGRPDPVAVTATLQPGVTNGYFKDEITLITNDSPPRRSRSRSWPTSRAPSR